VKIWENDYINFYCELNKQKVFFRHNQRRWEYSTWTWKTFLKGL